MRLLCAVLILLSVSPVAAGLLGSATIDFDGATYPNAPHQRRASLSYGQAGYPFDPGLFDDTILTGDSDGTVLTATALTDPDFADMAATMTNGELNALFLRLQTENGSGSGQGGTEQEFFGLTSDDFAGSSVDAITLTVESIHFEDDADTTRVSARFTVRVYEGSPTPVQSATWSRIKALFR